MFHFGLGQSRPFYFLVTEQWESHMESLPPTSTVLTWRSGPFPAKCKIAVLSPGAAYDRLVHTLAVCSVQVGGRRHVFHRRPAASEDRVKPTAAIWEPRRKMCVYCCDVKKKHTLKCVSCSLLTVVTWGSFQAKTALAFLVHPSS